MSLALSSCHYVLRPRPGLGQASVSLGAPRMPTNLLHHGPKNRAEKSAQNMAAIEIPRQYKAWLRPAKSYSLRTQTCQRDKATGRPRQTNEQTNSGTSQPQCRKEEHLNNIRSTHRLIRVKRKCETKLGWWTVGAVA